MKHPLPSPEVDLPGRRLSDRLVLAWIGIAVGLEGGGGPLAGNLDDAGWDDIVALLYTHRLASLALPGLLASGRSVPAAVSAEIARFKAVATRMNAANLLSMRRILPLFEAEGIPVLVFKGPVIQQLAYGDLFVRPSSDIDLLVDPADFDRSRPVLEAAGYVLSPECRSVWWRAGLGEQHFQGGGATATTVDLHHRVQQPGCPLPKDMKGLMSDRVPVTIGGQAVPTLSAVHSHLLAAMSFVKALHHREPALRYAVDFIALGRRRSETHWQALLAEARRQGLGNTVSLTLRACHLLFPGPGLPSPGRRVLDDVDDTVFQDMILRPGTENLDWPRRRDLLLALYDHKRDYPLGLGLMAGSEILRQAARGWPLGFVKP